MVEYHNPKEFFAYLVFYSNNSDKNQENVELDSEICSIENIAKTCKVLLAV